MPKFRDFSLGLNNANPSDQIDDRELSVAENVEYNHSSQPERRYGLSTSELNAAWTQLNLSQGSIKKSLAWSPKVMPNTSYGSYVYFVFTTTYKLYVIYKLTSLAWTYYEVDIMNVSYSSDSITTTLFARGLDRVIITDSVNKAHFVKIDENGLFVEGVMEYPAPKYIPKIDVMNPYDSNNFETNSEEGYLGECGLYVYCWCYADKWLNLSNPSPWSEPVDRQFFSFDDDGEVDKWVENLRIGNMKIPEIDSDTKSNIKYIYLFRKYYKHTQDLTNLDWDLYNVYEIANIDNFNEFIDVEQTAEGQGLDYGNSSPVAEEALVQGDSTFLAGCKTKESLLWDFEWSFPIKVDNPDNNIKVQQIYRLRISEAIVGRRNGITSNPFVVTDFFGSANANYTQIRKLCFFAQDKTTPLQSMLITTDTTGTDGFIDVFIKIPELMPGANLIYFCFTTLASSDNFDGIPEEFADTTNLDRFRYGRMFIPYDLGGDLNADGFGAQTMFTLEHGSLENARNIVSAPMVLKSPIITNDVEDIINRYDDKWNGLPSDCTWGNIDIVSVPVINGIHGIDSEINNLNIGFPELFSKIIFGENIDTNNTDNVALFFRYRFKRENLRLDNEDIANPTVYSIYYINAIAGNVNFVVSDKVQGWLLGIRKRNDGAGGTNTYFALYAGSRDEEETNYYVGEYLWSDFDLEDYFSETENVVLNIGISINPTDKKAWLYVVDDENNVLIGGEVALVYDDYEVGTNMKLGFGKIDDDAANYKRVYDGGWLIMRLSQLAVPNSKVSHISYVKNRTISTITSAVNLANLMYYSDQIIGYNWEDNSAYNNIQIQEGYPLIFKEKNSIMWASSNSVRFKTANQKEFPEAHKKMLPAPYFITTEYGNSVLEITRNTINRINLAGEPDSWVIDSNNFITEYAELGALSPQGWGVYRDRVFGHTEAGFLMWSKEGFRIISNKRIKAAGGYSEVPRIIVPTITTLISFPVPLRNQFVWHDNSTNTSYVYHLDQDAWTLFTGLDIIEAQTIDKGDNLENLVLFLSSDYVFSLYPSSERDGYPTIRTKAFELEDYMVKKIIPHFDGISARIVLTVVNRDATVLKTFIGIEDNQIQYVENGAWGHKFDINFTGNNNLTKLYDIEVIVQRRY